MSEATTNNAPITDENATANPSPNEQPNNEQNLPETAQPEAAQEKPNKRVGKNKDKAAAEIEANKDSELSASETEHSSARPFPLPDFYLVGEASIQAFPLDLLLDNNTPSNMVFPELGAQNANFLNGYAQDVPVRFENEAMLSAFTAALTACAELFGWDAENNFGVFVKAKTGE